VADEPIDELFVSIKPDFTDFDTLINDALSSIVGEITVTANSDALTTSINDVIEQSSSETGTVNIDGDNSQAIDAINQVVSEAGSETATIDIDANTSAAEDALSSLSDSAGSASDGVGGLDGGVKGLEATAGLAAGEIGGLKALIGDINPETAAAAGGLTVLAGATHEFFSAGLEAEGAAFRFKQILGPFAEEVEKVHIGDLNTSIGDLGLQLGTTDDALRNSISTFFQLGTSSGASGDDVAKTTDQLIALAARARALNPNLGDVSQIADRLSSGLARGGRILARYGISLTAAEINARALSDTGKTAVSQLTQYEKAAAGAALATEKLGDHLKEDIDEGAKNPIIKLDALKTKFEEFIEGVGVPLVDPIEGLLTKLEPVAEDVASILGTVLEAVLPLVSGVADGIDAIFQALDLKNTAEQLKEPLTEFGNAVGDLIKDASPLIKALIPAFSDGVKIATPLIEALAFNVEVLDDGIKFLSDHLRTIASVTTGPVKTAFDTLGISVNDLLGPTGQLLDHLDGIKSFFGDKDIKGELAPDLIKHAIKGMGDEADKQKPHLSEAQQAAALYRDTLSTLRDESPSVLQAFSNVTSGTSTLNNSLEDLAVAIGNTQLTDDALGKIAGSLGISTDQLKQLVDGVTGAITNMTDAATSKLPSVNQSIQELEDNAANLKQAFDPADIGPAIDKNIENITNFQANLDSFVSQDLPDIAKLAAENGPDFADAIAQKIAANPTFGPALEAKLEESDKVTADFVTHFHDVIAPQIINELGNTGLLAGQAFLDNFKLPDLTQILSDTETAGASVGDAFNRGLAQTILNGGAPAGPVNKAAQTGADAITQAFKDQWGIKSPSRVAMEIGAFFNAGLVDGLKGSQMDVVRAAEAITRAAANASRGSGALSDGGLQTSNGVVRGGSGGVNVVQHIYTNDAKVAGDESARRLKTLGYVLVPK
jgi:hypothetical protein